MTVEKHVIELTAKDTVSPALKNIGKEAESAGKKATDSAQKAAKSQRDWSDAAVKTGAAIGGLVAATSLLGRAHQSETNQIRALNRVYGDNSDEINDLADSYQKMGIASDDAVRIAALGAQSLSKNYGLTTDDIETLIERSADLSQVTFDQYGNQLGLADVMQRVSAAIRGEAESAEVLGVALNDQRLAALAAAEGLTGWNTTMTDAEKAAFRMKVFLDDTASAQGAAAERSGELSAKVNALKLQFIDAGSSVGGFLGPIGESTAVLGDMAVAAPAVGAAIGKMSLAMGPVGLGLAAVATTAALAIEIFNKASDDTKLTVNEATDAVASFNEQIGQLGNQGVSAAITQNAAALSPLYKQLGEDIAYAQTQLDDLNNTIVQPGPGSDKLIETIQNAQKELDGLILTEEEYNEVQQDTIDLLRYQGINQQFVTDRTNELWQQWQQGIIAADELAWNLNWLNDNSASYGLTLEELANQQLDASATTRQLRVDVDDLNESLYGGAAALEIIASDSTGLGKVRGLTANTTKSFEQMAAESAALDSQLSSLAQTLKSDFPGAAAASYKRVVGFTSGMVSAISTSKDWADALIAPVGVFSELDNMLAKGTIDTEDYNEAQQAQIDITDALTRATEASNEIQVKQADTVADGAKATADYLEELADLPEAQQALALAWADTDIAGQAMEVANLASQFGNMDDAQQAAFENMVLSAAATNPALADVLEDLGLIKEDVNDPTGWALDIDESEASASLQDVVDAIDRLTDAINGVPDVAVDATLNTDGFWETWRSLPSYKAINVYTTGGDYGPIPGDMLGGVTGWGGDAAALGRSGRGNMTLVGEAGPEIVHLPGGSRVEPNSSSRYNWGSGGDVFNFNGSVTIVANDPQTFIRQARQLSTTLERR